jgi:DNA-binding NarL/FixJ family response regulator
MTDAPIRVLVADDHAVVREGIRRVLEGAQNIVVVAEAEDGESALERAAREAPDVAVVDISMPGMSGIELTRRMREVCPDVGVLILSIHDHPEYVLEAIRAGAAGYLLKSAAPSEVRDAVRAVAAGNEHFAPEIASRLGEALRGDVDPVPTAARLSQITSREREVLALVAEGRTSREIGTALGISHRTVETHRESIMRKLGIRSVAGLTRFALEAGITGE